jgi:glycosyltransferase involved in cell wall biosynthesis
MTDLAVIMSVYKNDIISHLKESVQSILNQTYNNFSYYLVVDGPVNSDIETYINSLNDSRVLFYKLSTNRGLAFALNFLLEKVLHNPDYKFIARMDADDISLSTRFERQREFLLDNSDISCVGSWYREIDDTGKLLSDKKLPVSHDDLKKAYFIRAPFAHASVMYRRSLIEKAGFYPTDTNLMEDNVLWGKALRSGLKFANIPEYLFMFRKDRNFYIRRSGIKYGWHYIKTRFKTNRSLDLPVYSYLFTLIVGITKMLPSFLIRYIYKVT